MKKAISLGGFLGVMVGVTVALWTPREAIAQSRPGSLFPGSGVIDRPVQDQRLQVPRFPEGKARDDRPLPEADPLAGFEPPENSEEVLATIERIVFKGNEVLPEEQLQLIAAPYVGTLTRGSLAQLKFELTRAYYEQGYVLVRVVTPPQSLADGELEVTIVEARIGKVVVDNSDEVLRQGLVDHYADRFPVGEVFHESDVETAVTDINGLANVKSRVTLKPGEEVGTTDLFVTVEEADENLSTIGIDNYGSEFTGEVVADLRLQGSNNLRLGEVVGVGLRQSLDGDSNEDLTVVSADFTGPIGIQNWRIETEALYSENEIGDRLAALESSGESTRVGIALSRSITNTLRYRSAIRIGLEAREHETFLAGDMESQDDIRQVFLDANVVARFDSDIVLYGGLRLIKGISGLGASEFGDPQASRANGDPEAFIVRPSAYIGWFPTSTDSLTLTALGQYSSDVLLSSDLFAIGGYGSVAGFRPGQEAAESGYQLSLQYNRRKEFDSGASLMGSVFYELAGISEEVAGTVLDDELESAGIGIGLTSASGRTKARFDWAHPLGDYLDPDVDDDKYYLRIIQDF